MPTLKSDLGFMEAGLSAIEDYLLSNQLFWPLSAPYPRLTIGGLLIARARSRARAETLADQALLARLEGKLEAVRTRWPSAWERRALWEYSSRLNQWGNYLADYRQKHAAHAPYYPQEVSLRVILQLLGEAIDKAPEGNLEALADLDKYLRSVLAPGPFVWEPALETGFPKEVYWYLYGSLKEG